MNKSNEILVTATAPPEATRTGLAWSSLFPEQLTHSCPPIFPRNLRFAIAFAYSNTTIAYICDTTTQLSCYQLFNSDRARFSQFVHGEIHAREQGKILSVLNWNAGKRRIGHMELVYMYIHAPTYVPSVQRFP